MLLYRRAVLDKRVARLTQAVDELDRKLKQQRSAVAYFESLADRSSTANADEDSSCIICFEPITRRTVTPCGHMFCNACIKSCVSANRSCPTCRMNVSEDQLIEVKVRTCLLIPDFGWFRHRKKEKRIFMLKTLSYVNVKKGTRIQSAFLLTVFFCKKKC